jgi:metal-responsive CopG/Arc/MetJ family transcriptional regulator
MSKFGQVVHVRIPDDIMLELNAVAVEQEGCVAQVIRQALRGFVQSRKAEMELKEQQK